MYEDAEEEENSSDLEDSDDENVRKCYHTLPIFLFIIYRIGKRKK